MIIIFIAIGASLDLLITIYRLFNLVAAAKQGFMPGMRALWQFVLDTGLMIAVSLFFAAFTNPSVAAIAAPIVGLYVSFKVHKSAKEAKEAKLENKKNPKPKVSLWQWLKADPERDALAAA